MANPAPLTSEWIKQAYLFGVSLVYKGVPYPNQVYENGIEASLAAAETMLDLKLRRKACMERHDYTQLQWAEWAYIEPDETPILDVSKLEFTFGETDVYEVPSSWVHVERDMGQINIIPSQTAGLSFKLQQLFFNAAYMQHRYQILPAFYRLTYTAGFDTPFETFVDASDGTWFPRSDYGYNGKLKFTIDAQSGDASRTMTIHGTRIGAAAASQDDVVVPSAASAFSTYGYEAVTKIVFDVACTGEIKIAGNQPDDANVETYNPLPADIRHVIGMLAAMHILNPAGDLISGAGIASISASLDGVSQSKSTTSSATNAGYGARIIQYQKDIKTMIPAIRRRYHGAFTVKVV